MKMQPNGEQSRDKMLVAWIVITTLLGFTGQILGNPVEQKSEGLTLRIVHTNDMHSR